MNEQDKLCQQIVRILLDHPTPTLEKDDVVDLAKKGIKRRYRELRRQKSFTDAEIQAKMECIRGFLFDKNYFNVTI